MSLPSSLRVYNDIPTPAPPVHVSHPTATWNSQSLAYTRTSSEQRPSEFPYHMPFSRLHHGMEASLATVETRIRFHRACLANRALQLPKNKLDRNLVNGNTAPFCAGILRVSHILVNFSVILLEATIITRHYNMHARSRGSHIRITVVKVLPRHRHSSKLMPTGRALPPPLMTMTSKQYLQEYRVSIVKPAPLPNAYMLVRYILRWCLGVYFVMPPQLRSGVLFNNGSRYPSEHHEIPFPFLPTWWRLLKA